MMSMRLAFPWLCADSMPGRAVASLRKSGLMLKPAWIWVGGSVEKGGACG